MTDGVGAIASGEEIAPRRAARCHDGVAGGEVPRFVGHDDLARQPNRPDACWSVGAQQSSQAAWHLNSGHICSTIIG